MRDLPYSHVDLDRAGTLRADDAWVTTVLGQPEARVLALWRDRCLTSSGRAVTLAAKTMIDRDPVFLGRDGEDGWFAVDLSDLDLDDALLLADAEAASEIRRMIGSVDPGEASILAYARGLLHWHRNQRFCGTCGATATSRNGGHLRVCTGDQCGRLLFPRIEPAVITLVEAPPEAGVPDRCLLGRHRGARSYSTLAGFVEIGESLEGAVRREVFEEVGVSVGEVAYQASQAWPFPSGIMLGFRAHALSTEINVDGDEINEAGWFTRPDVVALIDAVPVADRRSDSIESFLINTWLEAGD
jgi:NAD+ diphosphatase